MQKTTYRGITNPQPEESIYYVASGIVLTSTVTVTHNTERFSKFTEICDYIHVFFKSTEILA